LRDFNKPIVVSAEIVEIVVAARSECAVSTERGAVFLRRDETSLLLNDLRDRGGHT